jgi:phage baseplate assembly protein V
VSGLAGEAWRRLRLLFAQGRGTLIDASTVQVQVLDSEVLESTKRVELYGFSYRPKTGCEVYLMFPAGDRARGVALVIGDKRYQMELAEGEVALHDDEGNFVKLGRGGVVTAKAATKVVADAPLFKATGNVEVAGTLLVAGATTLQAGLSVAGTAAMAGSVDVSGALKQGGKDVGSGHKHTSASPGTPTSAVN